MSASRKLARRAKEDQRIAEGKPKKGKLIKKLVKSLPARRKHMERAQQFALWVTACLINATGAHDVTRVLVDARKNNPYLDRAVDAWKALEQQEPSRTLTNADLPPIEGFTAVNLNDLPEEAA